MKETRTVRMGNEMAGLKQLLDWSSRAYRALDRIRERSRIVRYAAAALFVTLAFALQYSLDPVFHHRVAFTFFVTSALLAAWCGGMGVGLFALVAGFVLADYFFLPPVGSIGKYGKIEWALLIGNAVPAILGIALFELLHRVRSRLAARTAALEAEVGRRVQAEQELRAAQQKLRDYTLDLEAAVRERTGDLNEAVQFLERFCYSIAHDLRAPARALTGFVNVLEEELPATLSGDALMAAHQIRSSARRMDKLILDLLEYGRFSHVPLHFDNIPLQTAVARSLHALQGRIDSCGAMVKIDSLKDEVCADAELLQRVLVSILANALQFSKPNEPPKIQIRCEQRGDMSRLWIQDEGVGIQPEYQEKIFGPFQTLTSPDPEHTGIGLAIVRKCIERMRGRVGVQSEPCRGAAFWIELPLHIAPRSSQCRPAELGKDPVLTSILSPEAEPKSDASQRVNFP